MTERKKMARSERAKQFVPFAALKGYSEALQRKEEEVQRSYVREEPGRDLMPDPTANSVDKTNSVEYNTFVENFHRENEA